MAPLKLPAGSVESPSKPRQLESPKQKDYKYFKNVFAGENVKSLLKDLKVSLRDAKKNSQSPNPTLGQLEFKLAFIR